VIEDLRRRFPLIERRSKTLVAANFANKRELNRFVNG
jgi:hypothetical protein